MPPANPTDSPPGYDESVKDGKVTGGFRPGSLRRRGTARSQRSSKSFASDGEDHDEGLGMGVGMGRVRDADWGIGDDARMGLE